MPCYSRNRHREFEAFPSKILPIPPPAPPMIAPLPMSRIPSLPEATELVRPPALFCSATSKPTSSVPFGGTTKNLSPRRIVSGHPPPPLVPVESTRGSPRRPGPNSYKNSSMSFRSLQASGPNLTSHTHNDFPFAPPLMLVFAADSTNASTRASGHSHPCPCPGP